MHNCHCLIPHVPDSEKILEPLVNGCSSKKELIEHAKEIYEKHTIDRHPFYNYPNECWGYSKLKLSNADIFCETVSQLSGVPYTFDQLNRYVSFYWS